MITYNDKLANIRYNKQKRNNTIQCICVIVLMMLLLLGTGIS